MTAIIPRWEWRTFGDQFGPAEDAFAAVESTGIQESDELYLLSEGGDTVKVRADLMDVKRLREVDTAGLERWEPVLKAGFPIAAADLAGVFEALRIEPPELARADYTLEQFLDEVAAPTGVHPVQVHKRRVRYVVNGCTSEVSDVVADGKPTRTIAIESPDAAAVIEAIHQVGLDGYLNTSYPKGLTSLLEGRLARYGVIDVGTNSVKFHVGERRVDNTWHTIVDRAEVTRLGEGMAEHGGAIQPAAQERTVTAIAGMVDEARSLGLTAIVAVGTEGLRAAHNGDAVIDAIRARTGITVRAISGEEEGRLAYLAAIATTGHPQGAVVVFDTGGGSSQFTFGHGTHVDERFSVPVGAVRYTERFGLAGAVTAEVLAEAKAAIAGDLSRIDDRPRPEAFIAMGGAVTNLAAVKHQLARYDPDIVHMTVLDRADLDREIELFRTTDTEARRRIVGLQPGRAEVILAGACIVRTVMDKLGQERLTVCDRGLRHGLLDERFGPAIATR